MRIIGSFEGDLGGSHLKRIPVNGPDAVDILGAGLKSFFHALQHVLFLHLKVLQLEKVLDILLICKRFRYLSEKIQLSLVYFRFRNKCPVLRRFYLGYRPVQKTVALPLYVCLGRSVHLLRLS